MINVYDFTAHTPQTKVLGIGGSPRKNGNSDVLLRHILQGVQNSGVASQEVLLRDYQYQGCIGCENCRKDKICTGLKDGMNLLYPDVYGSMGMVLVSPTHNYNITAWMKAFIDRLYCFYDFNDHRPRSYGSRLAGQGRKLALAAVCEQVDEADMGFTMTAMRAPLEVLGYKITGELPVYGIFDRGKVKQEENVVLQAQRLGADLAGSLRQ